MFLAVLGGGVAAIYEDGERVRNAIAQTGTVTAHSVERQLDHSLSATYALAALVRQHETPELHDFDALSAELLRTYGGISSVQLAPNGVVTQIFPLAGNEAALGHDLLNDPQRRTEALAAIASRQLTLAGPFALIQGGVGVIGRLPVFVQDINGSERFWGFTIVLVHLSELLESSDLQELVAGDLHYKMWRIHPDTGEQDIFAQSSSALFSRTVDARVQIPNGVWTLSIGTRTFVQELLARPWRLAVLPLAGALVAVLAFKLMRHIHALRTANAALKAETTKRRRTEESQQRLAAILEATSDFVGMADEEGRVQYVNRAGREIVGIDEETDVTTTKIADYHPEWANNLIIDEAIPTAIRDGTWVGESALQSRDGREVPASQVLTAHKATDGQVGYLSTIMRDISERKRAEEALRQSEARYRSILEGAPIGLAQVDLDGSYVEVNEALQDILGYSREELLATGFVAMTHPDDVASTNEHFKALAEGKQDFYQIEKRYLSKRGDVVWVNLAVSLVRDAENQPLFAIGMIEDIRQRKQTEAELRAQRLEAATLADIGRVVNSTLDIEAVYERVAALVHQLIPFDHMKVATVDSEQNTLTKAYLAGAPAPGWEAGQTYPLSSDLALAVVHRRERRILRRESEMQESWASGLRSGLAVPLIARDEVIGVLNLRSAMPNAYGQRDLALADRIGAQIAGAIANAQAFDALQEAQAALQVSQERHRLATQAAHVGVWDWDVEIGDFYLDPNIKAMLGYGDEEIPNDLETWVTYVYEEDREPVMAAAQAHIDGQTPEYVYEHRMNHKDGSVRWVLVRGQALRDAEGAVVRLVGT
ncbi:MAG: hypothetical protein CL878_08515, partial [Dehalococcoidia bacterium]|nr:hypothetical protein [Dehalococcoidia bacterium]